MSFFWEHCEFYRMSNFLFFSFLGEFKCPERRARTICARASDLKGLGKKIEALQKGLPYVTLRGSSDGIPIFLERQDDSGRILNLKLGGERCGYPKPLALVQFFGNQVDELPDIVRWMTEKVKVRILLIITLRTISIDNPLPCFFRAF